MLIHSFSIHEVARNSLAGDKPAFTTPHRDLEGILKKYSLTISNHKKLVVPDEDRVIAFLHIGKTGGSTISVNIRRGCHECCMKPCSKRTDGWTVNETIASQRIQSYYHMENIPQDKLEQITTIVTTVRHPISRFISAFAYEHPINYRATKLTHSRESWEKFSCFPNLSYLVKAAMGRPDIQWNKAHMNALYHKNVQEIIDPINCTELALSAFGMNETSPEEIQNSIVNGLHPFINHMTLDYRQYYQSMPPEKELLVLRKEHLWRDWKHLNEILGRSEHRYDNWPAVPRFQRVERNVSHYYRKDRWIPHDKAALCQLLHNEIRTYLMIIERAVNLNEDDLIDAIADVDRTCSMETMSSKL